ncbi:hypothetical protein SLA2020_214360 [Shorea laevis]
MSFLRRRKGTASSKTPSKDSHTEDEDEKNGRLKESKQETTSPPLTRKARPRDARVSMAVSGSWDSEGLTVKQPVVFVPGIVTGGLELWEGRQCADGLFRKRLWGGSFEELYKRPLCWVEHMSLDNETVLDPKGIRVRPVSGLVATDYFAPEHRGEGPNSKQDKKAVVNIGGPFLGVPKAVARLFSVEARDTAIAKSFAPAVLDKHVFGFQTLLHIMQMTRGFNCAGKKLKNNYTYNQNANESFANTKNVNYGRIISFGKDVTELHSSKFERVNFRDAVKGNDVANTSRCEYDVSASFCHPQVDARGGAHFSHGIAETKLRNAPDMEIYSMHGVGIPTERAYVYKLTPAAKCYIPFLIDTSAEGRSEHSCLKGAVFSTNGDETAPVFSAGYMSAKGWRGKTNSTLQSSLGLQERTWVEIKFIPTFFEWSEKINLQH